ncbi:MAG: VWA domain-containing protein [Planctomycetaceae bacterium]
MNWLPGWTAPFNALLLLLLIPVIVMYFLKLKRTRQEIPSLLLWQQVIADQRVNAPFQRFKRNLLLWLQLLMLALLALAAAQPYIRGRDRLTKNLPILIDCSASMGAIDAQTKKTRLELAKDQIRPIIDNMLPDQRLMLIEVHQSAQTLTQLTDNKSELRQALDRIEVVDVPSRLEDALALARGQSKLVEIPSIRLYSDGNVPTRPNPVTGELQAIIDFELPFQVDYFRVKTTGGNVGITSLNASRSTSSEWEVFVRVECTPEAAGNGQLRLSKLVDGKPVVIGEERVILNPGESQRVVFRVDSSTELQLKAELIPADFDALAIDNTAWIELPQARDLQVFCPETLPAFRHALKGQPGLRLDPPDGKPSELATYDLVITDSLADLAREATTYLTIGQIPKELDGKLTIQDGNATVVDWKRDAPIMQHVQLREVLMVDEPTLASGVTDATLEELGFETLCHGANGPLMLERRVGPRMYLHWMFKLDRTTLPYRLAFPILTTNLVNLAMRQSDLADVKAASTGLLPPVKLSRETEYQVTNPKGEHVSTKSDADGWITGVSARSVGPYEVRSGGTLARELGVSLINPVETSLAGVEKLVTKEASVSATETKLDQDKPIWSSIASIAMIVLLIEWWYFQKKPG